MRALPSSSTWPTLILGRGSPATAAMKAPAAFERRRRSRRAADGFGNLSTCARTSSMSRSSLLDITLRGALFRSYHLTPTPSPLEGWPRGDRLVTGRGGGNNRRNSSLETLLT